MKVKLDGQICDYCGSKIICYLENGKLYFECSYCGKVPEYILPELLEDDEDEEEDMQQMW